ncbi:histidine phosphatase family protein [Candidatus Woesearchaeota archaeon]|nr:histidine phosphatase family protein [Candidatus Woesearchaeota archaeon]
MKLILVRHGQTEENAAKIIQGQTPGKLTELGVEQAKKIALRLQDEKIDIAYVSDLERTCQTAKQILYFHLKIPVVYTKELRERAWGIWEGKKSEERKEFFNEEGYCINDYKPQGGESFEEMQERMLHFIKTILEKHHKQTVLLVTHGGVLTSFYLHLFQKAKDEYKQYHPQNAAVTILEISEDKKHTVHVLNCVKHLG